MTPFGVRLRELRHRRGITLSRMARDLSVSAAYLSALEHGRRSKPGPGLVLEICGYFGLIWDEAEALKRLAEISAPKPTLDTGGLSPRATAFANRLASCLRLLDDEAIAALDDLLARVSLSQTASRLRRSSSPTRAAPTATTEEQRRRR